MFPYKQFIFGYFHLWNPPIFLPPRHTAEEIFSTMLLPTPLTLAAAPRDTVAESAAAAVADEVICWAPGGEGNYTWLGLSRFDMAKNYI
jgi:hypothetical protein